MLKILIVGLFLNIFLIADNFSALSINSVMETQDKNKQSKKYKDLLQFLKTSTSGEYSMYLAVIYLNGMLTPDEDGETISVDIEKSIKYFNKAINLEYYQASAILGSLYLYDERFSSKKDSLKKAKYYLKLAMSKKIYDASMALSNIYFYFDKNVNKGLEVLHIGANNGLSTAQLALATLYAYGSKELNISKNLLIGNQFLEKACLNKKKTKKVKEFCTSESVLNYKEVK